MPSKVFSWLRRKKKKKNDEPELTVFGEPIQTEKSPSSKPIRRRFSKVLSGLKPKRKVRLGFLLKLKRIFAGFLFVMYMIASIMLLPEPYALLFFGTSFILLDYLWKTRRVQWVESSDET